MSKQTIKNQKTGETMTFELLADYQTTEITSNGMSGRVGRELAARALHDRLRSGWKRLAE